MVIEIPYTVCHQVQEDIEHQTRELTKTLNSMDNLYLGDRENSNKIKKHMINLILDSM